MTMLTPTATSILRLGATRPCIQPAVLLRGPACCQYSTVLKNPSSLPMSSTTRKSLSPKPTSHSLRSASTTTSHPRPTSDHDLDAAAAAALASKTSSEPPLDWNTFFALRKSRRRWQLLFSVASSLAAGTGGALVLTTGAADALVSQVPLDPMITLGLMVFASAALGWLVGPSIGSQVFYVINRKYKAQMTVREVQFFARIKKNRVDPSNSSAGNPGRFYRFCFLVWSALL